MNEIIPWIIVAAVLLGVVVAITLIEIRLKRKKEAATGFQIGRVYQMEDGSLAKYIGDGKFVKVHEEREN